jgi:hypothetical protein
VQVYNFADLKLLDHIETTQNTKGLCALCPYSSNTVLVCPGLQKGHVRVELYDHKKWLVHNAAQHAAEVQSIVQRMPLTALVFVHIFLAFSTAGARAPS